MQEHTLPCLELLEATPLILRGLMCELSAEDVRWSPAPGRPSIGDVLHQLCYAEGHRFREVLDAFAAGQNPEIGGAIAGAGAPPPESEFDPEDDFDHFEEQRETNLEFLRGLPAGFAARTGSHATAGPITAGNVLHQWAAHDLACIRQVAEVAALRKYLPGGGPLSL